MKRSFTITELAERWGVSRSTVYRLMKRGEVPFFKVGSTRRVRVEDVEQAEKSVSGCVKLCQGVSPEPLQSK
jgi:excisionase family DNA binding protein